jgi:hypothetical protein
MRVVIGFYGVIGVSVRGVFFWRSFSVPVIRTNSVLFRWEVRVSIVRRRKIKHSPVRETNSAIANRTTEDATSTADCEPPVVAFFVGGVSVFRHQMFLSLVRDMRVWFDLHSSCVGVDAHLK